MPGLHRAPIIMGRRLFYSVTVKQEALTLFRANVGVKSASKKLNIPVFIVNSWFSRFLRNDTDWILRNDEDYLLRQEALALFQQGFGYKRVSSQLNIPVSRVKYWQQKFKFNELDFFALNQHVLKTYPKEFRAQIVREFQNSKESKKTFCGKHHLAVATLNNWLNKGSSD